MKTRLFPAHSLIPKSFQNPGFERLHWIEGILRGLEDHLYFPVNFALPPAFSSEDFLAFQQNAACIRLDQSGDQTGRRAFPHPLSPIRPRHSPASSVKLMPSTAANSVSRPVPAKFLLKLFTSSML